MKRLTRRDITQMAREEAAMVESKIAAHDDLVTALRAWLAWFEERNGNPLKISERSYAALKKAGNL